MKKEMVKEVLQSEYFCDICGKKMDRLHHCSICKKHICHCCVGHVDETIGDYPEWYCKPCWDTGQPYRENINQLEVRIDELYDEWYGRCTK